MKDDAALRYLSPAEILSLPGIGRMADLTIDYARDFTTACQALEKIATGEIAGQRDNASTAQIMREIAMEALKAIRYGDYAPEQALSKGGGKK